MIPCGLRFNNLTLEYKPDGRLQHSIEIFEYTLGFHIVLKRDEKKHKL